MIFAACRLLIVRCGIDSKDKALQKAIAFWSALYIFDAVKISKIFSQINMIHEIIRGDMLIKIQ